MDDLTRIRDLTRRYLDGLIAPSELVELQALLQTSSESADEFARLSRFESDLGELFAHEQDIRRESGLMDAIGRQQSRRLWLGRAVKLAVAACLLLAVLGPLVYWLTRPVRIIGVPRRGNEILAGVLEQDDGFARVTSTTAEVKLFDGSRVWLKKGSEVVLPAPDERRGLELRAGEGRFEVSTGDDRFEVETPVGRVIALGTEFSVQLTREERDRAMKLTHFVMTVAVLSGLVQVESDGVLYLLSGGESRAFGEERKREDRPARRATQQRGLVVSSGDGKLTIKGRGDTETTLEIGEKVKVTVDGKAARLSDLPKDVLVVIEKDDKNAVVAVRAEGRTIPAVVKSVGKDKVTVRGQRRNDEGTEYPVAREAKVTIDGKPGALSDLKEGDQVGLGLSVDSKTVLAIVKGGRDGRDGRPAGAVKSIDAKASTITLPGGRAGDRKFEISKDAKVMIGDKEAKLEDIKEGANVILTLDKDGKKVTAIAVVQRGRRDGGDQRVFGAVKSIDVKANTITLPGRGEDRKFELAKEVKVTIEGKSGKLEDIKEGTNVALTFGEDKKVKEITVTPARRRERE